MGHERRGESRQEREQEGSRGKGRPNRREFLAGSVGALAAARINKKFGGVSSLSREGRAIEKAPTAAAPLRVIIDTDPGVDDALAILLALRSPELQVEAITPVAGNVPLEFTLPNALKLVKIAGRTDVPVAGGARHPLVRKLVTGEHVHGNNGLAGVEFPEPKIKPVAESAPEMIRKIVKGNPGEISIVAVGPLTNVALALRDDPELAAKIKSIVIMGGSLSGGNVTPAAEFNLYVDPEAARIMAATLEHLNRGPHPMIEAMHDPLTVANLIDPGILTLKDYYVEVETEGEFTAGETIGWAYGPARGSAPMALANTHEGSPVVVTEEAFKANARVAVEVDAERFFRLLLGRLTA